jgi:hypothetical protein
MTNGKGVYTKEIRLGASDNISNWYEITEEEYQIIEERNRQEARGEFNGESY